MAADIVWTTTGPSPWPGSEDVLAAAVALLPTIADDDAAQLVEQLAVALVDTRVHLRAVQDAHRESLTTVHELSGQVRGLRRRLWPDRA